MTALVKCFAAKKRYLRWNDAKEIVARRGGQFFLLAEIVESLLTEIVLRDFENLAAVR